jgi:hypothetical protein
MASDKKVTLPSNFTHLVTFFEDDIVSFLLWSLNILCFAGGNEELSQWRMYAANKKQAVR